MSAGRREAPIARGRARARVERPTGVHRLACTARDVRARACVSSKKKRWVDSQSAGRNVGDGARGVRSVLQSLGYDQLSIYVSRYIRYVLFGGFGFGFGVGFSARVVVARRSAKLFAKFRRRRP